MGVRPSVGVALTARPIFETYTPIWITDTLSTIEVEMVSGHKTLSMLQRYTHLRSEEFLAKLVHVSLRAWQLWESGDIKMPPAAWELCVIKCEMHPKFVPRKSH